MGATTAAAKRMRTRASAVTKAEVVRLLERTELFGALPLASRRAVAAEMTRHDLPGGTVLFSVGEPGDALYVVIRGRLQVLRPEDDLVVAEIAPGQVVGELALLSGSPRNATVRAARDTSLLRLDAESFDRLVAARPTPLLALAKTIVDRLGKGPGERGAPVRSIALVAAGQGSPPDLTDFAASLCDELRGFGTVEMVDAAHIEAAVGIGLDGRRSNGDASGAMAARLDAIERANDRIVYVGSEDSPAWRDRCLREADLILLVARAEADPTLADHEAAAPSCTRRHLVLLHPPDTAAPHGTNRWLEPRPNLVGHHHVRVGRAADVQRVARRVAGRGVGVVFGGGGPRGFAHLGVIRALEEAGTPVDVAGGASVGSMVAALCGFDVDHERRLAHMTDSLAVGGLFRPTLPLVSLTSSRRITKGLRAAGNLGDRDIEDFWIPWHCVSTNLSRGVAVVHDRGPAWRAVRASIALPGLLPPVHDHGDLLVDGGVLNNLPVDAMRARLDGRIVAVDLEPPVDLRYEDDFDPTVTGWGVMRAKLNPFRRAPRIPNLIQIVLRAKQVGGAHAQRWVLAEHAIDVYLQPPIDDFGALNFKAGPGLVDAAYRYTLERLEAGALSALVRPSPRPASSP